jgi:Histidine kinase
MKTSVIFLFFCLTCCMGYTQSFPILKYSAKDGLGHPVVYRMFQDQSRMLWFSTDNGLTRYDGYSFSNFTTTEGLLSNYIFTVDSFRGKMAICTYGGGVQFLHNGAFLTDTLTSNIKYPINLCTYRNRLFIVDKNSMSYRFDGELMHKVDDPVEEQDKVLPKHFVYRDTLYACGYGIWRYDESAGHFIRAPQYDAVKKLNIYNAIEVRDKGLLLTTGSGLMLINHHNERRIIDPTPFFANTGNMLQLTDGTVLVSYLDGRLVLFDPQLSRKTILLEGVIVNDIKQDHLNNIWLCTYGKGVWKIPSLRIAFHSMEDLLAPAMVIDQQQKTIEVVSLNGNNYTIRYNDSIMRPVTVASNRTKIGYSGIFTQKGAPDILFRSNEIYRHGRIINRTEFTISAIFKDKAGIFWVGTKPGLYKGASLEQLQPVAEFNRFIVRCITEDQSGRQYIGTDSGLLVWNTSGLTLYAKERGLNNVFIRKLLYDDQSNRLWIGTADGLYVMEDNRIKSKVNHVGVYDMKLDAQQHLWVACSWGLLYYNQRMFKVFSEQEGLQTNIQELHIDEADNSLHLLATDKYFKVNFDYLRQDNRSRPQIVIDKQLVNDLLYTGLLHSFEKPINKLQIYFSVPHLNNKFGLKVKYRINGSNWVPLEWTNSISATNISYGNNEVEINLYDEINQQVLHTVRLIYRVKTPFWKTSLFYIALFIVSLLLTVATILGVLRFYQQKKIKKLVAQQYQLTLEHKVLSNMLNPHFLNNALNSIQAFVVKNDQRKTLHYVSKFARLMRINLELLDKNMISLDKELKNIALYVEFEQLRNPDLILFEIVIDEQIDTAAILLPSLSLQPFVENAIWHGILPMKKAGRIKITVQQADRHYTISIEDNGVGYLESLQSKKDDLLKKESKGIQIIKDRIHLLNQVKPGHHIEINSLTPNGTVVIFSIPR